MAQFDGMETPTTFLGSSAEAVTRILIQPVGTLWKEFSSDGARPLELLFFVLNSLLWGFAIAFLGFYGGKLSRA